MSRLQILVSFLTVLIAVFFLVAMGRPLVYEHGPVRLWSGNVESDQNSQQIADPYSLTHIEHGILLYGAAALLPPQVSLGSRFVLALGAESLWEVFENTDFVVNRYRAETISLNYYGDSVLNAFFDIMAAVVGFFIARRFSWKQNLLLIFALEFVLYFWIGDGLLMNIIQLA